MIKRKLLGGAVLLCVVAGLCFYAHSQSHEVKQDRLNFALREFTGTTHDVILADATAVVYLYPKIVDAVITDQGKREAAYIQSLPAWSPLKEAFDGWETFVAENQ